MKKLEFEVGADSKGQRLDKFLFEKLLTVDSSASRSRIKLFMENGQVFNAISGEMVQDASAKTKEGAKFFVLVPPASISKIVPQDIDFEIIFEDENMLVINKPAGLITHPGNGKADQTLVNALLFRIGQNGSLSGINGVLRPGIVHRLDKDTSGLMVVAKNDLAHKSLAAQIENRELKRSYLALCYGLPKPLSGRIENNMERSHKNRLKMVVAKSGKSAVTNYEVQKIYFNSLLSLVECRLDTGRTHQIRVHMNEIGHPLIGDQLYKNKRRYLGGKNSSLSEEHQELINKFPRQFLHSYKIRFSHPVSGEEMEFKAKLPSDLRGLLDELNLETGEIL